MGRRRASPRSTREFSFARMTGTLTNLISEEPMWPFMRRKREPQTVLPVVGGGYGANGEFVGDSFHSSADVDCSQATDRAIKRHEEYIRKGYIPWGGSD